MAQMWLPGYDVVEISLHSWLPFWHHLYTVLITVMTGKLYSTCAGNCILMTMKHSNDIKKWNGRVSCRDENDQMDFWHVWLPWLPGYWVICYPGNFFCPTLPGYPNSKNHCACVCQCNKLPGYSVVVSISTSGSRDSLEMHQCLVSVSSRRNLQVTVIKLIKSLSMIESLAELV